MTRRLERATEVIKREVSAIIPKCVDLGGALLTLTRVELTEDLQYADVYFMVIPDRQRDEMNKVLAQNIFEIQHALNQRLRMRPVPKVRFHHDEAELEATKIDEFLKRV